MPGLRKSTYAEKRKAKGLGVYYKYAHLTYDTGCDSLGYLSDNRVDKIQFVRHGFSWKLIHDNILSTLETQAHGYVQNEIQGLMTQFQNEHAEFNLGNLTLKDLFLSIFKKIGLKPIPHS